MNQFKSAWQFAYNHWQFLAVMAFPVFLVEVITAYYLTDAALLMEAGNIDDITMYFEANSLPITLLSFISIILGISFTGGTFVAFNALTDGEDIKPFDALFIGFKMSKCLTRCEFLSCRPGMVSLLFLHSMTPWDLSRPRTALVIKCRQY